MTDSAIPSPPNHKHSKQQNLSKADRQGGKGRTIRDSWRWLLLAPWGRRAISWEATTEGEEGKKWGRSGGTRERERERETTRHEGGKRKERECIEKLREGGPPIHQCHDQLLSESPTGGPPSALGGWAGPTAPQSAHGVGPAWWKAYWARPGRDGNGSFSGREWCNGPALERRKPPHSSSPTLSSVLFTPVPCPHRGIGVPHLKAGRATNDQQSGIISARGVQISTSTISDQSSLSTT